MGNNQSSPRHGGHQPSTTSGSMDVDSPVVVNSRRRPRHPSLTSSPSSASTMVLSDSTGPPSSFKRSSFLWNRNSKKESEDHSVNASEIPSSSQPRFPNASLPGPTLSSSDTQHTKSRRKDQKRRRLSSFLSGGSLASEAHSSGINDTTPDISPNPTSIPTSAPSNTIGLGVEPPPPSAHEIPSTNSLPSSTIDKGKGRATDVLSSPIAERPDNSELPPLPRIFSPPLESGTPPPGQDAISEERERARREIESLWHSLEATENGVHDPAATSSTSDGALFGSGTEISQQSSITTAAPYDSASSIPASTAAASLAHGSSRARPSSSNLLSRRSISSRLSGWFGNSSSALQQRSSVAAPETISTSTSASAAELVDPSQISLPESSSSTLQLPSALRQQSASSSRSSTSTVPLTESFIRNRNRERRSFPYSYPPSNNTSSTPAAAGAPLPASTHSAQTPIGQIPRIPAGTSLIVQGLVQTSAPPPVLSSMQQQQPGSNPLRSGSPSSDSMPTTAATGSTTMRSLPSRRTRSFGGDTGDAHHEGNSVRGRRRSITGEGNTNNAFEGMPSFDEQAILLSGLLSVATAATANSLLSGGVPPAAPPPRPASTMESIRQRLRGRGSNNGNNGDGAGIEDILRNYMAGALTRPSGVGPQAAEAEDPLTTGASSSTETPRVSVESTQPRPILTSVPSASSDSSAAPGPPEAGSFEEFLASLQTDLVAALRDFNGLPAVSPFNPAPPLTATTTSSLPVASTEQESTVSPVQEDLSRASGEGTEEESPSSEEASGPANASSSATTPANENASSSTPSRLETPDDMLLAVDAARRLREQLDASAGNQSRVPTTDQRRLNWMRVYRFPPRVVSQQDSPPAAPTAFPSAPIRDLSSVPSNGSPLSSPSLPPTSQVPPSPLPTVPADVTTPQDGSVIPLIMVGIRSIARADASQMFNSNGAEGPSQSSEDISALAADGAEQSNDNVPVTDSDGDAVMSGGESVGGRVRRAWNGLSRVQAARAATAERERERERERREREAGTRSFVLWVVGGLYAPDHPILAAPGLFSGNLDHDDLWALAELLGSVKPPTASQSDIDSSTLPIIKGNQILAWESAGKLHSNTADRCTICLGDYGEEEDCRVLACKHAFHKECVDHWLGVGRNQCPCCRGEGVLRQEPPVEEGAGTNSEQATAANAQSSA